jgi:hypothetical protein
MSGGSFHVHEVEHAGEHVAHGAIGLGIGAMAVLHL